MITNGANVNALDEDNWTPLHKAVRNDKVEIVRILIENGANVNFKSKNGRTPLHEAAFYGELSRILII